MTPRKAAPLAGALVPRGALVTILLLGIYLSLRGYHSFDGDQAYRLPMLLHRQDPTLYADDPFVRALDDFNPHRGSLMVLDAFSRPLGLPAGLFVLFALTFAATCQGIRRIASAVWPELAPSAGWVAVVLLLAAKAGNIGTNHLFEAMVLDRLIALALGWQAIAAAVTQPLAGWWRSTAAIALATLVHPSVGLQLAMVLAASWAAWPVVLGRRSGLSPVDSVRGILSMAIAVVPGLAVNVPQNATLLGDLPRDLFWVLSVELQSPQHMLPHLWRMPQWLACGAYLALAVLQLATTRGPAEDRPASSWPAARQRLAVMLALIVAGLGLAWSLIELGREVRVTIFQPFRMATVARGIALIFISGRVGALWRSGSVLDRVRAIVLAVGFLGDWLLVVTAAGELAASVAKTGHARGRFGTVPRWAPATIAYSLVMARGLHFLGHHDTESGHVPLLIAIAVGLAPAVIRRRRGLRPRSVVPAEKHAPAVAPARREPRPPGMTRGRLVFSLTAAWALPVAALIAGAIPSSSPLARHPIVRGLVDRCRFLPAPVDDVERLAIWCREHTPASSRFIGPPGPKTFRLWSRRSVAFNRSASPYHAAGLTDWFSRFADHVDFHGTPEAFVEAYLSGRHRFEARYQALSDAQRASLATRQGAGYVIADAPESTEAGRTAGPDGPLELLHTEGRYAVYRVRSSDFVQRQR